MEITRRNFNKSLPLIESSIERSDFLVIDTEFTGLNKGKDASLFDSPMEYYQTILNGCSDFLLTQFGLCAFIWEEDTKQYTNEAYNFYLFPRGGYGAEKMFLCQSSSLDFLAAQGFDFNKWIKEGISYVTESVENNIRKKIIEKHSTDNSDRAIIPIPDENKQQIEDICERVRKFIEETTFEKMEIDRCNPFIRRLLFQEFAARFKDAVFVDSRVLENKDRVLVVSRLNSADDTKNKQMMKEKKDWDDFEDIVGFSKVARMISQSGKLVIGHNMLLDVLHTLNHFFQTLPTDYKQFKEFAHCMFPRILDTKYMSSQPSFKDKVNSNVLQHLYSSLSEEPFSLPTVVSHKGIGYMGTDDKKHEAGYDAYVTGVCFIAMHKYLFDSERVAVDSPLLQPYLNKLFLARTARQDSPFMNLNGVDPTPPRDHVFHMTFPKEWQRNEINQLFSPYGKITVQFLDETSAYVALSNPKRVKEMLKALSGHNRVKLVPFARYKGLLNKVDDRREWPTTKKFVMRSGDSTFRQEVQQEHNMKGKVRSAPQTPVAAAPSPARPAKKGTTQVDETDPSPPKKSRLRTISNSKQKKEKQSEDKNEDTSKDEVEEIESPEWPLRKLDSKAEVFMSGTTQCASVFKESDSWV